MATTADEWANSLQYLFCRGASYLSPEIFSDSAFYEFGCIGELEWDGSHENRRFKVCIDYSKESLLIDSFSVIRENVLSDDHWGESTVEKNVSAQLKQQFHQAFDKYVLKEKPSPDVINTVISKKENSTPKSTICIPKVEQPEDILKKWISGDDLFIPEIWNAVQKLRDVIEPYIDQIIQRLENVRNMAGNVEWIECMYAVIKGIGHNSLNKVFSDYLLKSKKDIANTDIGQLYPAYNYKVYLLDIIDRIENQ